SAPPSCATALPNSAARPWPRRKSRNLAAAAAGGRCEQGPSKERNAIRQDNRGSPPPGGGHGNACSTPALPNNTAPPTLYRQGERLLGNEVESPELKTPDPFPNRD